MTITAALEEARASAPTGQVIIETLTLYHPSFVDSDGQPSPLFVVNESITPLTATLEAGAPQKGGQQVTFIPIPFKGSRPEMGASRVPVFAFEMDNIGDEFAEQIELSLAVVPREPIYCIVREYLSDNLSAPSYISAYKQALTDITVTPTKITAQAQASDSSNVVFLRNVYTLDQFPGLVR